MRVGIEAECAFVVIESLVISGSGENIAGLIRRGNILQ